jgi:hypothetical protein
VIGRLEEHAFSPLVDPNATQRSSGIADVDWAAKPVAGGGCGANVVSMSYGSSGGGSNETSAAT